MSLAAFFGNQPIASLFASTPVFTGRKQTGSAGVENTPARSSRHVGATHSHLSGAPRSHRALPGLSGTTKYAVHAPHSFFKKKSRGLRVQSPKATEGTTIRVFISSTFSDMQGERDALVKHVFPELNERCRPLGVSVVPVDLRWGITSGEAAQNEVVCLNEIDACDTGGAPWVVALRGDRYGYVPETVAPAADFDHPEHLAWREATAGRPMSITSMEVRHGILNVDAVARGAARHAFAYFREQTFAEDLDHEHRKVFAFDHDADDLRAEKAEVDAALRAHQACTCREYRCLAPSRGSLATRGLEDFSRAVLEDLWERISEERRRANGTSKGAVVERGAMVLSKEASRCIGREICVRDILRYARSFDREHLPPLLLVGDSGIGKTAVLGQVCKTLLSARGGAVVVAWTASLGSCTEASLLQAMCAELVADAPDKVEVPQDPDALRRTFAGLLSAVAESKKVILVIDGVDTIDGLGSKLNWLPDPLPRNTRVVLSVRPSFLQHVARSDSSVVLQLSPLTLAERRVSVRGLLAEYRKTLSEDAKSFEGNQMGLLIAKRDAGRPVYLAAAVEALRIFGSYEELSGYIRSLPESTGDLFHHVLQLLEEEHGRELVAAVLACLAASREGLAEIDLIHIVDMCVPPASRRSNTSRLRPALQHFVTETGAGRLKIRSSALASLVRARYVPGASNKSWEELLIQYFSLQAPSHTKAFELPHQYLLAGDMTALFWCVADARLFTFMSTEARVFDLYKYCAAISKQRSSDGTCAAELDFVSAFSSSVASLKGEEKRAALYAAGRFVRDTASRPEFLMFYPTMQRSLLSVGAEWMGEAAQACVPASLECADALCELGWLLHKDKEYASALEAYQRCKAVRVLKLGRDHRDTAQVDTLMGWLYLRLGSYEECELCFRAGLKVRERVLGSNHPDVAQSLHSLGWLYGEVLERHEDALTFLQRALPIASKYLHEEHTLVTNIKRDIDTFVQRVKDAQRAPAPVATVVPSEPVPAQGKSRARAKKAVSAYVRVRPFSVRERQMDADAGFVMCEDDRLTLQVEGKEARTFTMSGVFDPSATQEDVFERVCLPLVSDFEKGVSSAVIAYGQTGGGKTFSIVGGDQFPGMLFSTAKEVFKGGPRDLHVSIIEVYNEVLNDLCSKETHATIRRAANATLVKITSFDEFTAAVNFARRKQMVASTSMNSASSRSHVCYTLGIAGADGEWSTCMTFGDLAGSERVGRSGVSGAVLKEAMNINKSLSNLGSVLSALSEGDSHVPYRNSKLTHMLQPVFQSGNIAIFGVASPSPMNDMETICTLSFLQRLQCQ